MPESGDHRSVLRAEFERASVTFDERTTGRFAHLKVAEFSRVQPGATVLEVGAGTGGFLAEFDGIAGRQVGIDLTAGMLGRLRARRPHMHAVIGDGARLPIRSHAVDLIASAQMFHHVEKPLPILKEMRRVAATDGHALIVDQVGPEKVEELEVMHRLEVLRDPSHAATRPPSGLRVMVRAAGFEIVDERIASSEQRLSTWMWPGEFPSERIAAVADFIRHYGSETGMDFARDGDDWVFRRVRMMLLLRRG